MEDMNMQKSKKKVNVPTSSYVMASWLALFAGVLTYLIGLYNAGMQLNEKGYYLTVLLFGLYSAVSLQKVVRDKNDGIPTTNIYYGICWMALLRTSPPHPRVFKHELGGVFFIKNVL